MKEISTGKASVTNCNSSRARRVSPSCAVASVRSHMTLRKPRSAPSRPAQTALRSPLAQKRDPSLRRCHRSSAARPASAARASPWRVARRPVLWGVDGGGRGIRACPRPSNRGCVPPRIPGGDKAFAVSGDQGDIYRAVEDRLAMPCHRRGVGAAKAVPPPPPTPVRDAGAARPRSRSRMCSAAGRGRRRMGVCKVDGRDRDQKPGHRLGRNRGHHPHTSDRTGGFRATAGT